jgi:hypothetical protein
MGSGQAGYDSANGALAYTGGDPIGLAVVGVLLLVFGILMLVSMKARKA